MEHNSASVLEDLAVNGDKDGEKRLEVMISKSPNDICLSGDPSLIV